MTSAVSLSVTTDLEPKKPRPSLGTEAAIQHDKAALQDARLRTVWDDSQKEAGGPWRPHREGCVLMFAWDDEWDELGTSTEVEELSTVFETLFNYKVFIRKIKKNDKLPQHQVAKELTTFIYEHDKDESLLIVYYAGHGMTTAPGTLILLGEHESQHQEIIRRNSILWHKVERNLEHTRADVLTIFDCCFAGNLIIPSERSTSPRNFEFLAATGKDATTPKPGPNSFTKALIWALEKLSLRKTPFSTIELLHQIGNEAPIFSKRKQVPILKERFESSDRRLMLAPIRGDISYSVQPPVLKLEAVKESVDLRFFFDRPPDVDDIKWLHKELKKLIDTKAIPATRIGWVGLTSRDIVKAAAMKWMGATRMRRSNSSLSLRIPLVNSPQNMNGSSPTLTSIGGDEPPVNYPTGVALGTGNTWFHLHRFFCCLTQDLLRSIRTS